MQTATSAKASEDQDGSEQNQSGQRKLSREHELRRPR